MLSGLAAIVAAADRRADRLCRHALSLPAHEVSRDRRDHALRGRRHGARHRPHHLLQRGLLVLTGGWLIMVIAYVVRKLPFSVRASASILHQIDPSLEEASINLGVSPVMTFLRLTVPLMLGGIVGGMVLTWVTVSSELSATVVLYSGQWQTLTVVMFQALERHGRRHRGRRRFAAHRHHAGTARLVYRLAETLRRPRFSDRRSLAMTLSPDRSSQRHGDLADRAHAEAMASAPLGDDSRDGDPTVRRLEALGAETHRQGGRALRAERHHDQSRGALRAYGKGRRGAGERGQPYLAHRDGRASRRSRASSIASFRRRAAPSISRRCARR